MLFNLSPQKRRWIFFSIPLLLIPVYIVWLLLRGDYVRVPTGGTQLLIDNYYWLVPSGRRLVGYTIGAVIFFILAGRILPAKWWPTNRWARMVVTTIMLWGLFTILFHAIVGLPPTVLYLFLVLPVSAAIAGWFLSAIPWVERWRGIKTLNGLGGWVPVLGAAFVLGPLFLYINHVYQWQVIVGDSHSQISQARLLATGSLVHDIPQGLRDVIHIVYSVKSVPSYSMYPPGHILLHVPLILAGLPVQSLNVIASALMVLLVGVILRKRYGSLVASVGMLILACSPFFLIMGAEAMNHATCALMLLLVFWLVLLSPRDGGLPRPWALLLAGVCLGWAFITRPLTAVSHGMFWTGFLVLTMWRTGGVGERLTVVRLAGWTLLGGLIPILVGAVYNFGTTGHPLRFGYTVHADDVVTLGFGVDRPHPYTPLDAIQRLAASLTSLQFQMTGWIIGSWVLLLVWWKGTRLKGIEGPMLLLVILQCGIYMLYHYHDLMVGPRFYFEIFPFLVMLGAIGLAPVLRRGGSRGILVLLVVIVLCAGGLRDGMRYWENRYALMVGRNAIVHDMVSHHVSEGGVYVFPFNDAEGVSSGRFFPALAGEPEVWFVRREKLDTALKRPELQPATWIVDVRDGEAIEMVRGAGVHYRMTESD